MKQTRERREMGKSEREKKKGEGLNKRKGRGGRAQGARYPELLDLVEYPSRPK